MTEELQDAQREVPPEDPIIAELRATREALFAAAGHDLAEFARRLRAEQARSAHPVVTLPRKPAADAGA